MATKDKLINLEDLKVLSDHVEGEVTDLKSDFNDVEDTAYSELFSTGNQLSVTQTITGQGLLANGRRAANEQYSIDIIAVNPGDVLRLKITADSAGVWQWQNDSAIPVNYDNTYIIGGTKHEGVDGFETVPPSATWLIVSRNSTRTDNVIAKVVSKISSINENLEKLNETDSMYQTKLLGENLVNGELLEVGYYYLRGVKSESAALTTAWIDVHDLTTINASGLKLSNQQWSGVEMYYICSYDEDKNYINNSMDNTGHIIYTIPEGAKYITVSYVNTTYDDFTVIPGTKRPARYVNSVERKFLDSTHTAKWYGLKWTAMGDSLTEYNFRAQKNYIEYIAEKTGLMPTNLGVSGTGYRRGINNNNSFYNRVSTIPSDCDALTIFGSLNDLGDDQTIGTIDDTISDDTVFGYVNATIDAIYSQKPTINIGIISPTPWKDSKPWSETDAATQYANGLKQICYRRGIPFLDLYHCSNLRPWDATARNLFYKNDIVDGVNAGCHPDSDGHKMIATKIEAFLSSLLMG